MFPNLFNEINASLQIHSKVDEFPLNTFLFIFFLFQDEHVMVKELLKPFVGVVDTQLFKAVELYKDNFLGQNTLDFPDG